MTMMMTRIEELESDHVAAAAVVVVVVVVII